MKDQEVSLPAHAIRLRAEKSFLEGKVLSGWTTGWTCMWDAQIRPDGFRIFCNVFMIDIFPYGRADNENRVCSQSGRAVDCNLDQTSCSRLSLQSLLSFLSSLCSSQQPSAGYLVLACGAEVSLSYQTCGLCLFAVYEVHIRADTHHPESVCVFVKYGGRQNTHMESSGPVWRLVIKGSCSHSFCNSPPFFAVVWARAVNCFVNMSTDIFGILTALFGIIVFWEHVCLH